MQLPGERRRRVAALNMLGHREKFAAVPFFWSQHYDIPINYVGHAAKWEELVIEGDIAGKDCLLRFNALDTRSPSRRSSATSKTSRRRRRWSARRWRRREGLAGVW